MRLYVHFEEDEPNHTAALTAGDGDTVRDLATRFLEQYADRFGDSAVALDIDSIQVRTAKKKKLKPDGSVSLQLTDKEDVFLVRSAPSSSKTSLRQPASVRSQTSGLSACSSFAGSPVPRVSVPPVASAVPSVHEEPPPPARAAAALPEQVATPQGDVEMELLAMMAKIGTEELNAFAAGMTPDDRATLATVLQKATAAGGVAGGPAASAVPSQDKFKFAQDRPAVVPEDDEEIQAASPTPTHVHNVQANCLKCGQHIFYKAEAAHVACHSCRFLHSGAECPACGTFFPMPSGAESLKCPCCASNAAGAAFQACRAQSFSEDEAHVAQAPEQNEIHLIMQYYMDRSAERREEVAECLRQNVANPHIRHVHVLTEEPMDLDSFQQGDKIVQYVQGAWLSYVDAVQYAARFLRGKVVVLANADVHFDHTLARLARLDLRGRALALTRFDARPDGLAFNPGAAPISQDAWIFRAPLPTALRDIDFKLGKPGCDNRFAYELRVAGLRVTNPCFAVTVVHRHASDARNYVHGVDTVTGAYAAVVPIKNLA
jgi:hypothetical protein